MSTSFKDHFSRQAATYAAFRPEYPFRLYGWLGGVVTQRALAWDVGTGSGQAAVALAAHFGRVVGTDASAEQIAHATPHPRVEYRVATAEASGFPAGCATLVTVAQALHWFDRDRFHSEVRRVLVPGGVVAVWCYGDPKLDEPALDRILHGYNRGTVEQYWPLERDLVLDAYRSIAFPFAPIDAPALTLEVQWSLPQLMGYPRSWSATARYVREQGHDPVEEVEQAMAGEWGPPEAPRWIRWPLTIRAG